MFLLGLLLHMAVGAVVGGAVGSLVGFVIGGVIDLMSIKEETKKRCPEALAIEIQKKKKNAVDVKIFTPTEQEVGLFVEITSSKGVSDELYEGQRIYL